MVNIPLGGSDVERTKALAKVIALLGANVGETAIKAMAAILNQIINANLQLQQSAMKQDNNPASSRLFKR